MSETVHYRGKLKEILKLENETLEQQCERACNSYGVLELKNYYDNWIDCLEHTWYQEYYIRDNRLYQVEKEDIDTDDDMFRAITDDDGIIHFDVKYYNGDYGFNEALNTAFEKMNKEMSII